MIGENGKESKFSSGLESIILFDSSTRIEEFEGFLQDAKAIISLDFESHETLSKSKIKHEVSDNYLNKEDLTLIQKNSYALSKWFNEESVINLVEYSEINLGQLLEVEFNYFLVPFLKKFVELSKICKKYPNAEFITSSEISSIVRVFTQSVMEIRKKSVKQKKTFFDTIKYDFKIGKNYFSIRVPVDYYKKLKNVSESIFNIIFGLGNNNLKEDITLLVEFDPIKYANMFLLFPTKFQKFALYNRRRPSIWNLESYSVIRKSSCRLATSYGLSDDLVRDSTINGVRVMETKIISLLEKDNFFKDFFEMGGYSFWEVIKPNFVELIKKRMNVYVEEIEIAKKLLIKYKFKSIIILSEIGSTEQIITKLAKKINIPIILLQHGLFFDTKEAFDMNLFQGVFPSISDKYVVWGDVEKKHVLGYGTDPRKIEALGNPVYDVISNLNKTNKEDFILLATSSPVKEDVHDLIVKTNEEYEECIKKICRIVSNMNKKLVVKLHPSPDELDVTRLAKEIDPRITVVKGGNILQLLNSCELLVVVDVSTVILEAQLFRKPVISVLVKDYGWGTPSAFTSNSCITTKIENFESVIKQLLNDENFKQNTICDGTKFAESYLSNQGTATEKILDFLDKL